MHSEPSRQQGMTLIGFLLMFVLICFFALLVLKIAPIYLEHFKVLTALQSVKKEGDFSTKSKEEILSMLEKRFDINSIDRVSAKDVTVVREGGQIKRVQIAYEVVEPIMGNVSVLVEFDDSIESGGGN
jgi:hypothetical protein